MTTLTISSNLVLHTQNIELINKIKQALKYSNPKWEANKKAGRKNYGVPRYIELCNEINENLFIIPKGFTDEVLHICKNTLGCMPSMIYNDNIGEHLSDLDFIFNLRNYQCLALDELKRHCRSVLVSPAGSGKTVIGLAYIHVMKLKAVWLVHNKDLVEQTFERALQCMPGIKVGIVGGGKEDFIDKDIIICTFQTLTNRPYIIDYINYTCGVLVIDECHHTPSTMFNKVIGQLSVRYMLGLTATPTRKDGYSFLLHAYVGQINHIIDRSVLYNDNKLIIPEICFVPTNFNEYTAVTQNNDSVVFNGDQQQWHLLMEKVTSDNERSDLIVDKIIESVDYANNQDSAAAILVVSDRVEYCANIQQKFTAKYKRNCRTAFIHGGTDKQYRANCIEETRQGVIKVLFATTLAKEGLDIPNLVAVHLVTPMKGDSSKHLDDGAALEQTIGRVMRTANFKKYARVYDYVDHGNSILKNQYYSRRRTYKRLNIPLTTVSFKEEKSRSGKFDFTW